MSPVPRHLIEAGAQEAGRAVALLLRKATAPVVAIETLASSQLATRLGARALVVGFTVSGGLPGRFALATTEASATKLAQDLVGKANEKRTLGALTELGNIGASAWLNGVARALETACVPSVPNLVVDEAGKAVAAAVGDTTDIAVATLECGGVFIELCFVR